MGSFTELMHSIPPPFNMFVAIALIVGVLGVVKVVVAEVGKYAVRRRELDFKREMVERGLEVDEIERLMRAGGRDEKMGTGRWE